MPRTPNQIEVTDATASRIFYQPPPRDLEPTGPVATSTWRELSDWFETHTGNWDDAILVYISRRWDTPISTAYFETDSWMKSEVGRRGRRDDPNAVISYN